MVDRDGKIDEMVEQLTTIEESLRDLLYDALRARSEGGGDKDVEKRYEQARRSVEKAIRALRGAAGSETDGAPEF